MADTKAAAAQPRARSDKPARILTFLRHYVQEHGYPPSVRDVVAGCELSSTSVADYNLRILERQGHITRDSERARTIVLTQPVSPPAPVLEVEPLQIPCSAPSPPVPAWSRPTAPTPRMPMSTCRSRPTCSAAATPPASSPSPSAATR